MSGFYQNCRGLRTKLNNFKCNVSSLNCDFIVLTETWLTDNFSNSELGLDSFNIFGYDRCSFTSNCLRGGGVLISVHKDIPVYSVPISQLNVEHIFVHFSIGTFNFIVGGVYIHPLSSLHIYKSHISSVEILFQWYPEHTFIICGDYNLPEVSWNNDENGLLYSYSSLPHAPCIPESFITYDFFQVNNVSNLHSSILDLVFCTDKRLVVEKSCEPLIPIDQYHLALNITLPTCIPLPR